MPKYEEPVEGEWVQPEKTGYRIACCDCGKVHKMDFRVLDGRAQFRVFDAPRSTGQVRRHMHPRYRIIRFTRLTPMEHAERVVSSYLCLRELPPKVIKSIKARIAFEIRAYGRPRRE